MLQKMKELRDAQMARMLLQIVGCVERNGTKLFFATGRSLRLPDNSIVSTTIDTSLVVHTDTFGVTLRYGNLLVVDLWYKIRSKSLPREKAFRPIFTKGGVDEVKQLYSELRLPGYEFLTYQAKPARSSLRQRLLQTIREWLY